MATFSETCAPTSRKYIAEQGTMARSMAGTLTFLSHFSVFAFEKYPKSIKYQKFFTFKESLVATFNENYALTSRKYVVEQDKTMPNLSQSLYCFWLHFSVFALEK